MYLYAKIHFMNKYYWYIQYIRTYNRHDHWWWRYRTNYVRSSWTYIMIYEYVLLQPKQIIHNQCQCEWRMWYVCIVNSHSWRDWQTASKCLSHTPAMFVLYTHAHTHIRVCAVLASYVGIQYSSSVPLSLNFLLVRFTIHRETSINKSVHTQLLISVNLSLTLCCRALFKRAILT